MELFAVTTSRRPGGKAALRFAARLGLALAPVVLFGAYAARPAAAFLTYCALVPWIVLYTDDRHPRVAWLYYFVSLPAVWLALYPQTFRYGTAAVAIMPLFWIVPWMPFAPALSRIHARFGWPRAVTVPLVWTTIEWLRHHLSAGYFDIYQLGYAQARFPALIQISEMTGVYGVSFVVAAWNGLVADALFAARDASWRPGTWLRSKRLRRSAAFVVLVQIAVAGYGVVRFRQVDVLEGPRIAVVQPNEPHTIRNVVGVHLAQVLLTERDVPRGSADLIVWPENAVFEYVERGNLYHEDLRWLAREKDAAILVGAVGRAPGRADRTTNRALLVRRDGAIAGGYDKQAMFPWSESVPLDRTLERIWPAAWRFHRSLSRAAWGYLAAGVPGNAMSVFHLNGESGDVPFGVLICHENAFPPFAAEAARRGARLLVNITSESDLGGPVQEQLLRVGILRAVENRMGYVRCGNTGISAFLDPRGIVTSVLVGERGRAILDRGVLIDRASLGSGRPTIFARSREAFAKTVAGICALVLLGTYRPKRSAATAIAIAALVFQGCGGEAASPRSALEASTAAFQAGEAGVAIGHLRTACGSRATCAEALGLASDAFLAAGRPEQGVLFFTSVIDRYPDLEPMALGLRGLMHEKSYQFRLAERDYIDALHGGAPQRFAVLLGTLRGKAGDRNGAVEAFRQAVALDPKDAEARRRLASALIDIGDRDRALELLRATVRDDPGNADAWTDLGRALLDAGERDEARDAFDRSVALDPEEILARYFLARLALRDGDDEEAERLLRAIQAIEAGLGRGPRES